MSRDKFNDDCPGCQPALIDTRTGEVMPSDAPAVKAVMRVWAKTTRIEREAYHRVCCQNSRDPRDLSLVQGIAKRMEKEMGPEPLS